MYVTDLGDPFCLSPLFPISFFLFSLHAPLPLHLVVSTLRRGSVFFKFFFFFSNSSGAIFPTYPVAHPQPSLIIRNSMTTACGILKNAQWAYILMPCCCYCFYPTPSHCRRRLKSWMIYSAPEIIIIIIISSEMLKANKEKSSEGNE